MHGGIYLKTEVLHLGSDVRGRASSGKYLVVTATKTYTSTL